MRHQGPQGWIGVDLDGTLAMYETGDGINQIGIPIDAMVESVKRWLEQGIQVRVFTARVAFVHGMHGVRQIQEQKKMIQAWCIEHIGQALDVTCIKDFHMIEFWDDRCVQVIPNTGECVECVP
jgi:hypothetical protein